MSDHGESLQQAMGEQPGTPVSWSQLLFDGIFSIVSSDSTESLHPQSSG
ncbi:MULTISPECIES: hypothetical protein [Gammaproteobacteria]|nr:MULTISPECIES: hypothetical protein [Gammaproteobacteria]MBO9481421.1 hypothetical protein [Salinisphaera sp. G21_0]MBO9493896.1 hypothetical protein [Thalassotalea sp. G20_0]